MNAESNVYPGENASGANPVASDNREFVAGSNNRATAIAIVVLVAFCAVAAAYFLYSRNNATPQNLPGGSGSAASVAGLRPLPSDKEHPLAPALAIAQKVKKNIEENVHDYTATVYKQERYLGVLGPIEVCDVKIRSKPFSVYMKFSEPEKLKGQEALYVQGANEGKLIGHAGSGLAALVGSKWLEPTGAIAMLNQRYPITELGVENLVRRLIEVGEHDQKFSEGYVWQNDDALVGDRPCISFTVLHPVKRTGFIFHIARIFVDKELLIPLHYEAYDWPAKPGDPPLLLERYTYANLKTNVGLTDADFDPKNAEYKFGVK